MLSIQRLAHSSTLLCLFLLLSLLVIPSRARADPLFGPGEDALEDAFVDGDLDEEDHVAMHLGGHTGASDIHGQSWVCLLYTSRCV